MGKYIMYLWAPNLEEFFHTQFPLSFTYMAMAVCNGKETKGVGWIRLSK